MQTTLALAGLLTLATAILYAYVGRIVRGRSVASARSKVANEAFQVWWFGLALATALGGVRALLGSFGVLDRGLHAALLFLSLPALAAALYGLVYYLVYLYTGDARWRTPILAFHAAFGVALFMLVVWMHPLRPLANPWSVGFVYEHEPEGALLAAVLVPLLGPSLLAAFAYFTLFFRVQDPVARYRIGLVSVAILAWFGSAGAASALGWSRWDHWPLASRTIALGATLLILLAYKPPRIVRERIERPGRPAPASGADAEGR